MKFLSKQILGQHDGEKFYRLDDKILVVHPETKYIAINENGLIMSYSNDVIYRDGIFIELNFNSDVLFSIIAVVDKFTIPVKYKNIVLFVADLEEVQLSDINPSEFK